MVVLIHGHSFNLISWWIEIIELIKYNKDMRMRRNKMEIADLLKKQQLKKIEKESSHNRHMKRKVDRKIESGLKKRRLSLHLTIPQISAVTGINQVTLKRWETSGMTPNDKIAQIHKYAKVMHLNLAKLVQSILN